MSIKKKMGAALVSTALGAALIGGGTFALFTESVTNAGNTFTAGEVKITDTTGGNIFSTSTLVGNLAPGDSETKTVKVKNDGNLDVWVRIDQVNSKATGDLFTLDANHATVTYDSKVVKLEPQQEATFNVTVALPRDAGNSYEKTTGSLDVVVQSVQARNNTNADGNGPTSWQ
jgi:spore coat-associated protein N